MSTKKQASAKKSTKAAKKPAAKKTPAKTTTKKSSGGRAETAAAPKRSGAATKSAAGGSTGKSTKKAASKSAVATRATKKKQTKTTSARTIPAGSEYLADTEWLDAQRKSLLEERAKYTSSADRLAAEAAELMADREPGDVQFDEESGEGDTIAVERDRDLALSAAARQAVTDIDAALARLDDGSYGFCLAGDDVIPKERLEAIPEAAVCVQHKTSMF